MSAWTIRRAEHRDADALSECFDAAYALYAERIDDLPPVSADCAGEIAKYQVWVAECENRIVGGLVLIPKDGFMLLANVAIHPDHKGAGLGRSFMTLAERETLAHGFSEMWLTTHVDMPENVQLYKHFGWTKTGQTGTKISMRKSL